EVKIMSESGEEKNIAYASETKKIWVTLTAKYADILNILADETPDKKRSNRKSVLIEKMVDEFLEVHEKELKDDGKWNKIISVRKKAANSLDKSIEEKIEIVDIYIKNYPDKYVKIINIWEDVKAVKDIDSIDKIYHKIRETQKEISLQLDNLLEEL
ncbi:MAG: hypothetical protein KAT05_08250, partial [Spirochaetes bacterium]|nr:hypothetical protein [Spirochaetota bacterium]